MFSIYILIYSTQKCLIIFIVILVFHLYMSDKDRFSSFKEIQIERKLTK